TAAGGYIIQPVHGTDNDLISIKSVYATITQGLTNWHDKYVGSSITTLTVDLNWGNPANSLWLKVHSPEGYTFGPFYDNYDGYSDGRVNLNINNPDGITKGTWYYEVYGDRVTGTQSYYI
ncbi:MAG: peptidase domain-containing protein, partial [Methanoregula sp.]